MSCHVMSCHVIINYLQDEEGFQSMVKEMTETQKVAAINAYQKSLMMGQTQTVSQSQVL